MEAVRGWRASSHLRSHVVLPEPIERRLATSQRIRVREVAASEGEGLLPALVLCPCSSASAHNAWRPALMTTDAAVAAVGQLRHGYLPHRPVAAAAVLDSVCAGDGSAALCPHSNTAGRTTGQGAARARQLVEREAAGRTFCASLTRILISLSRCCSCSLSRLFSASSCEDGGRCPVRERHWQKGQLGGRDNRPRCRRERAWPPLRQRQRQRRRRGRPPAPSHAALQKPRGCA